MIKAIDAHAHYLPSGFVELIRKDDKYLAELVEKDENTKLIQFKGGYAHPYNQLFIDPKARLQYMDEHNIECHVLSVSPRLFYYGAPAEIAAEIAYTCNNEIHSVVNRHRGRFVGMATVPLQDIEMAVKELKRVKDELGFSAVEIGSEVNDKKLSDPYFLPFFEEAAKNDMFILIHPQAVGKIKYMEEYYLGTILGHPFYTTIAIANLILSGIFDKLPKLKIGLSHGGGYLPYQLGRLEHGFRVRKETKADIQRSPMSYIKDHVYFDTITHSKEALGFLIKTVGADNVFMGTDYPFDMCEMEPVNMIQELGLSKEEEEKILFGNACELFKIG
ncbi:MAG: hypothetical protein HPY66_0007 [Firmicutes bacterium]|nr:hypothetical protein [Bacillota bacterium]